jgi:hypothetical protein
LDGEAPVDPISLILSALVAGSAKAAGSAAQDAYAGLKALIIRKFESHNKTDSPVLLAKFEQKPEKTRSLLEDELTEAGFENDQEVIQQAEKLLELFKAQNAAEGTLNVEISGGTVQGLIQQNSGTINQSFN